MKSNCYAKYAVGFISVKTFGAWDKQYAFKNVIFFDVNKHNYSNILWI